MDQEIREKSKLYVGNLPYELESNQLKEVFRKFGEVINCFVIKNKGFGFIEYALPEEAQTAKETLNDMKMEIEGRVLVIDFAIPKRIE